VARRLQKSLRAGDTIARLGCDYVQGDFFARPLEQEAATAIILRNCRWDVQALDNDEMLIPVGACNLESERIN
jgi:hypothetical protein